MLGPYALPIVKPAEILFQAALQQCKNFKSATKIKIKPPFRETNKNMQGYAISLYIVCFLKVGVHLYWQTNPIL